MVHDPLHLNALLDVTPSALVYCTNRRNDVDMDVVVRSLATGEEHVAYDGGGFVVATDVSHDGRAVAVTGLSLRPASTVVTVAREGESHEVTDREETADHVVAGWTADDAALVLASSHGRDLHGVARVRVVAPGRTETTDDAVPTSTGGRRDDPAQGGTPTSDDGWQWLVTSDDHPLAASLSPDGSTLLVAHHVDGADTFAIHEVDGTHRVDVDLAPVVPGVPRWAPDASRVVLTVSTPTDPGSIVSVDALTGQVTRLVDGSETLPADLRERLVSPTVHRVPAPDGEQVPCFRYAPPQDAGASGGCVVHVHGGPEGEARRGFSAVLQALALSGLDVLVPNVRGSDGYGQRWLALDDVDKRLDSVADLAAIHAWLPSLGLDPDRAALWGASYGGYMVLAGVSMQPDLWAAGVDIVGMSSLVTFLRNTSDYRRAYREREYGSLEHDLALLEEASPLTHLDAVRAPLFVIHGANDPRVPLSEAEQITAALDAKGIDCALRVYPDEGHGLSRRENRLDAYPAAIDFLLQHLRRRPS